MAIGPGKMESNRKVAPEIATDGYWEADLRGTLTRTNPTFGTLHGRDSATLAGTGYQNLLDSMAARRFGWLLARVRATRQPVRGFCYIVQRPDGSRAVLESSVHPIADSDGRTRAFRGVVREVRVEAPPAVEEAARHPVGDDPGPDPDPDPPGDDYAALVAATIADPVAVLSPGGRIRYLTPSFETLSGHPRAALRERPFSRLVDPRDRARVQRWLHETGVRGGAQTGPLEFRLISRGQDSLWVEAMAGSAPGSGRPCQALVLSARVVTRRKVAERRLSRLAFRDAVTGLPNRALLMDRVEHALRRRRAEHHTALMFIDLDGFKAINDTLGHMAGDAVLREVGRRLAACLRDGDTLARLGGDEYVVLLEDLATEHDAREVARRMREALGEPIRASRGVAPLSASIGIAFARSGQEEARHLLAQADRAMYEAKRAGGSRIVIQGPLDGAGMGGHSRARIHAALRQSLAEGRFQLLYQPILGMEDGHVVGLEALLRWQHPTLGPLRPGAFLRPARESGLIVPLGRHVLRMACESLAVWHRVFPGTRSLWVSVNVSGPEIEHPAFAAHIGQALAAAGLPGESLLLEIGERGLSQLGAAGDGRVAGLEALGVGLVVERFGSASYPLVALPRLPVRMLKFDAGQVAGVGREPEAPALVRALSDFGEQLGLPVVATRVERPEQARHLQRLGCHVQEGYHVGRPMRCETTAGFLAERFAPERPRRTRTS